MERDRRNIFHKVLMMNERNSGLNKSKVFFVFKSNSSLSINQYHAYIGAKVVRFSLHSLLECLIIASSIRLVSLVKMSEEAVMQFFGPDNVAIQKVRFIVLSTSSLISLVLIQDNVSFEVMFHPDSKVIEVILNVIHFD